MKTGVRVSKGREEGCTGPGCPSKDVNFYKVEWGAVSGITVACVLLAGTGRSVGS